MKNGGLTKRALMLPELRSRLVFSTQGSTLKISVKLEPSGDQYIVEFDGLDVIAYTVRMADMVNHVHIKKNGKGGIYS